MMKSLHDDLCNQTILMFEYNVSCVSIQDCSPGDLYNAGLLKADEGVLKAVVVMVVVVVIVAVIWNSYLFWLVGPCY